MSFHMGSLGFLTPFQFSSQPKDDDDSSKSQYTNAIQVLLLSWMCVGGETGEVYQKYIEQVLKGL